MIKKTDFSAIKAHSEERIRNKILVGCVTEVNINGETVWSSVHGMADISEQKKMSRDAIFRLASMSKPITGAAVMQLVEKGRLGLYDDISKYIPQLKNFGIAGQNEQGEIIRIADASRGITLFDLLNHSSGLAQDTLGFYQYDTMNFRPQKGEKLSDVIPKYKDILLDCDPGTAMGYGAHAAFDTLGYIVELISGMSFGEYLKKYITGPLGMKDTTFHPSAEQLSRLVKIYTADGTVTDGPAVQENMIGFPESFEGGSSCLLGTVEDYMKFAECLLNGGTLGDAKILAPDTVKLMSTPLSTPQMKGFNPDQVWGLSMRVITSENPEFVLPKGTYGWSGAYGTHFIICPEYRLTAVYASNLLNGGGSGAPTAFEFEADIMNALKKQI